MPFLYALCYVPLYERATSSRIVPYPFIDDNIDEQSANNQHQRTAQHLVINMPDEQAKSKQKDAYANKNKSQVFY